MIALPLGLPMLLGTAPPPPADLIVVATNVRSAKGMVRVDICPQAKFLKDGCTIIGSAPARVGSVSITIRDVPPGSYAAQIYLDENGNSTVDQGFLGIPKEGIGFSNDAKIRLGPPKWAEAVFVHDGKPQTLRIRLRYMSGAGGPDDTR